MLRTVTTWVSEHRGRLAKATLALAVAVVALQASTAVPREARLQFAFGAWHRTVTRVELSYWEGGGLHKAVRFDFPTGAPSTVEHRLDLLPGAYEVRCTWVTAAGTVQAQTFPLTVPAEGRVRLHVAGTGPVQDADG